MESLSPKSADRLRLAVAKAAAGLARGDLDIVESREPAPGGLYALDTGTDIGIEWSIVRQHPDDPGLVLLAPVDDFPLVGFADLQIPFPTLGRTLTVRCGQTDWFPADICRSDNRVGTLPVSELKRVRQRLAEVARGRITAVADPSVDLDPAYEEWMAEVAAARVSLLSRSAGTPADTTEVISVTSLSRTMPDYLRSTPQVTLAAEDGGSLISRLSEALADEGDRRYCDIDLPGGTLTFEFDSFGVMGIWNGASAEAPSMTTVEASGERVALAWRRGPEGILCVSGVAGPWADGRLELLIGVDPQRRLVFSL